MINVSWKINQVDYERNEGRKILLATQSQSQSQHTFTWLFLGGLIASDCFLIRIMAYSGIITNNKHRENK